MLDPLILKAISIGMGLLFLLAAVHKFSSAEEFRATLEDYQVMPLSLVGPAARIVPIVELLLGGSWLLSYYQQTMTAIASAALFFAYTLAIGINLYRGRVHIDCGCHFSGKGDSQQFLSGGLVIRNLLLIIVVLSTLLPIGDRVLGFSDYVVVAAVLLAASFLFAAVNQLIANRAAIDTWRKRNV